MYAYMYVCIHVYMCMCMCVYIYMYVCMYGSALVAKLRPTLLTPWTVVH